MDKENLNVAEKVLHVVEAIQQKKRENRCVPDYAMIITDRLYDKVSSFINPEGLRNVLRKLVNDGVVKCGDTVNDTYVRIVDRMK